MAGRRRRVTVFSAHPRPQKTGSGLVWGSKEGQWAGGRTRVGQRVRGPSWAEECYRGWKWWARECPLWHSAGDTLRGHLEPPGRRAADLGQVISLADSECELSSLTVCGFKARSRRSEPGVQRERVRGANPESPQFLPQPEDGARGPATALRKGEGRAVGQAAKAAPGGLNSVQPLVSTRPFSIQ